MDSDRITAEEIAAQRGEKFGSTRWSHRRRLSWTTGLQGESVNAFSFLCAFLLLAAEPAIAQGGIEQLFIEKAQSTPVQQLDPALPPTPLAAWLNSIALPSSEVTWEVNDCGEQTGGPADRGRDFPACVEAIFAVAPKIRAHVSVVLGTFKQGVIGQPRLFQLFVEHGGRSQGMQRLSDLPALGNGRARPQTDVPGRKPGT